MLIQYYNRWANHEQSAKLSIDLYAKTEKKMEDMQVTSSLTWIEVRWIVGLCPVPLLTTKLSGAIHEEGSGGGR